MVQIGYKMSNKREKVQTKWSLPSARAAVLCGRFKETTMTRLLVSHHRDQIETMDLPSNYMATAVNPRTRIC
jgi:hypothetical protein